MQPFGQGDAGPAVADVRAALVALGLLRYPSDRADTSSPGDCYDGSCELAVRTFQQQRGLTVDGLVGQETYRALTAARWQLGDRVLGYSAGHAAVGDDVGALQTRLLELGYDAGRADGVFGRQTELALRGFQRDYGLADDGTCGPATMRALRQLGRKVTGGRPQLLRETTALATAGPQLLGKRVVVDPGHGGGDTGHRAESLIEAVLTWDLANRLQGRLAAAGVTAELTRGLHNNPADGDRARFANAIGADLLISLHVDHAPSPRAEGASTYHFGTGNGVTSTVGEQLAGLVQREVVARSGLTDGRTHAKTWELLRLTRMPAIRLEAGYLSHDGDRRRLADPGFRDLLAEAVLVAVQRLYLPADVDPPTGTYRVIC
ncbi:MAG: N-acetylmuramoyl-L-alanine amidase [Mycobacteriales bacterium]|nr:MAG: N-acetylmuramoyl-L-alanine amidase [Pseudonocardiales bacterium]